MVMPAAQGQTVHDTAFACCRFLSTVMRVGERAVNPSGLTGGETDGLLRQKDEPQPKKFQDFEMMVEDNDVQLA